MTVLNVILRQSKDTRGEGGVAKGQRNQREREGREREEGVLAGSIPTLFLSQRLVVVETWGLI